MKQSILALAILFSLASCKKNKTPEFVATDVTGKVIVWGNLNKNVIVTNGSGGWTNTGRVPVRNSGLVTIKVNRNSLYPNSTASGADVYYGKTDSLGNYAVEITSNAQGVNAEITIDGFNGTLDTLINGQLKKGFYANYTGTNSTRVVAVGKNAQVDHNYFASPLVTNPNSNIKPGTAIVTGNVYVNVLRQVLTGTMVTLTSTNVALPNRKVYMNFSNDPNTLSTRSYETVTDGNGNYSFTVNTVETGTSGFSQSANIWINDYASTKDTIAVNNSVKPGKSGVYTKVTNSQNAIFNGTIRNAVNFTYISFIPD